MWPSPPQLRQVRAGASGHCNKHCQFKCASPFHGGYTYITREVTHLITLAASDILCGLGLGAIFSVVTLLFAVFARRETHALLGTVASSVANLLAINALDVWCNLLLCNDLLLAMLLDMAELIAVGAKGNATVLNITSRLEPSKVLFLVLGPVVLEGFAARLSRELDRKHKLATWIANNVHNGLVGFKHLFETDEVDFQAILAKCLLNRSEVKHVDDGTGISAK